MNLNLSNNDWRKDFEEKLNKFEERGGITDSVIEDFIDTFQEDWSHYLDLDRGTLWKYYYQLQAKGTPCEGCAYILSHGYYPCSECSRVVKTEDHYAVEICFSTEQLDEQGRFHP